MPSRTLSPRMSTIVITMLSPMMMLSSRCRDKTNICKTPSLVWERRPTCRQTGLRWFACFCLCRNRRGRTHVGSNVVSVRLFANPVASFGRVNFAKHNGTFPHRPCVMRDSVIVCKGAARRARFRDNSRTHENGVSAVPFVTGETDTRAGIRTRLE
jgi:hypothetical protein